MIAGTIVVGAGLGAEAWLTHSEHAGAAPQALVAQLSNQGTTVLEPGMWIGKRFPLMADTDLGWELARGQWIVVLYDSGCPACRRAVPQFELLAGKLEHSGSPWRVALIEMPPYADADEGVSQADTNATIGRLSDAHPWFAVTPLILLMKGGRVLKVFEGEDGVPGGLIPNATR
jgi:thiol-disulfide isomerase/thioredoxin